LQTLQDSAVGVLEHARRGSGAERHRKYLHLEIQEGPVHSLVCGVDLSRAPGEARDSSQESLKFHNGSDAFLWALGSHQGRVTGVAI
jgi:hypothetical protein